MAIPRLQAHHLPAENGFSEQRSDEEIRSENKVRNARSRTYQGLVRGQARTVQKTPSTERQQ
jgi:hypothetical protein